MLLGPERNESLRNPPPYGAQTVEAGVAGSADSDKQRALVDAGLTMMHMEAMPRPAGLAGAAVAIQNILAQAIEAPAGVSGGAVAGAAEAGDKREFTAAGAEQGPLPRRAGGVFSPLHTLGVGIRGTETRVQVTRAVRPRTAHGDSRMRDCTGYRAKPLSKVTSVAPLTAA